MIDSPAGLDLPDVETPDPLYFQQASMLMLAFRFEGSRKVVASRLLIRDDFVAELVSHLPVLERVYPDWDVRGVEIVSFQRGAFYYDEWPGAMEIVRAWSAHRASEDAEPDDASTPGEADAELADGEAA